MKLTGIEELNAMNEANGVIDVRRSLSTGGRFEEQRRAYGFHQYYTFTFREGTDVSLYLDGYLGLYQHVIGGRRLNYYNLAWTPNDPDYDEQWHYDRINMEDAWDVERGDPSVIVAVLDSGVQTTHPDLAANIWNNPGEIANNGIDDDGNGFIDDVVGWDFANGDNDPDDNNSHGTHVAGTIAAVNNNGVGVSGIAGGTGTGDGARIMALRIFSPLASDLDLAEAFMYAADNGAVIANNSWKCATAPCDSTILDPAIDYFEDTAGNQGGLVIFAAGNNNNTVQQEPGDHPSAIKVASTDSLDNRSSFSNFGNWVTISAPGSNVYSTVPGGYDFKSGTSMAAPHVAGLAALLLSREPSLTPNEIMRIIKGTRDDFGVAGRINAGNALAALQFIQANYSNDPWFFERKTVGGGSVSQTTGMSNWAMLGGYTGASVASGVYLGYRKRMDYSVNYDPGEFLFPRQGTGNRGFSGANPNFQWGWSGVVSDNGSTMTLRNNVYDVYNIVGSYLGSIPVTTSYARAAYGKVGGGPGIRDCTKIYHGDFDGDGATEVFGIASNGWMYIFKFVGNTWQIIWNNDGNPFAANAGGIYDYRNNMKVGDFDGDGKDELLGISSWLTMFHYDNGQWNWGWSNYGDQNAPSAQGLWPYRNSLVVGDFDGDGSDEVMGTGGWITMFHFYNNSWHWGWSNYGDPNASTASGIYPYRNHLVVGDFDSDGKDEVMGMSSWTTMFHFDNNSWHWGYSNYGNQTGLYPYRYQVQSGDFDGDGDSDLFGGTGWMTMFHYYSNNWNWGWSNYGDPNASNAGGIYPYRHNLYMGDYDGDGSTEALGRSSWTTMFHYYNNSWNWGWSDYGQ